MQSPIDIRWSAFKMVFQKQSISAIVAALKIEKGSSSASVVEKGLKVGPLLVLLSPVVFLLALGATLLLL